MLQTFPHWVLLFLFAVSNALYASSPAPIEVNADTIPFKIYPYSEVFEDKSGDLSIEDVSSDNIEFRKTSLSDGRDNAGFTQSAFWLRVQIINRSEDHIDWFFSIPGSPSKTINAYIKPEGSTGFSPLITPIKTRLANFRFSPRLNKSNWIYFRVHDLYAPLTFSITLKNANTLLTQVASQYPIYGIR